MKVEKCPRCGREPRITTLVNVDRFRIKRWISFSDECWEYHAEYGFTRKQATRRWNRWARREAKRIEREKK